jgi:hypothetical protein
VRVIDSATDRTCCSLVVVTVAHLPGTICQVRFTFVGIPPPGPYRWSWAGMPRTVVGVVSVPASKGPVRSSSATSIWPAPPRRALIDPESLTLQESIR